MSVEFTEKSLTIEKHVAADVLNTMGTGFDSRRFVPYVAMHEYEAMLFSDCAAFAVGIGQPEVAESLQAIRDRFETPEEINDSTESAPSVRIAKHIPGYQKPIMGCLAALEIGLQKIRGECPHFRNWLERLECLVEQK